MSAGDTISTTQFGPWKRQTDPGGQVIGYTHPDIEHGIEKAPYGDMGPKWRYRGDAAPSLRAAKARAEAQHVSR